MSDGPGAHRTVWLMERFSLTNQLGALPAAVMAAGAELTRISTASRPDPGDNAAAQERDTALNSACAQLEAELNTAAALERFNLAGPLLTDSAATAAGKELARVHAARPPDPGSGGAALQAHFAALGAASAQLEAALDAASAPPPGGTAEVGTRAERSRAALERAEEHARRAATDLATAHTAYAARRRTVLAAAEEMRGCIAAMCTAYESAAPTQAAWDALAQTHGGDGGVDEIVAFVCTGTRSGVPDTAAGRQVHAALAQPATPAAIRCAFTAAVTARAARTAAHIDALMADVQRGLTEAREADREAQGQLVLARAMPRPNPIGDMMELEERRKKRKRSPGGAACDDSDAGAGPGDGDGGGNGGDDDAPPDGDDGSSTGSGGAKGAGAPANNRAGGGSSAPNAGPRRPRPPATQADAAPRYRRRQSRSRRLDRRDPTSPTRATTTATLATRAPPAAPRRPAASLPGGPSTTGAPATAQASARPRAPSRRRSTRRAATTLAA